VPSRGEVWLVDLGMIQKVRPALILNRSFKDEDLEQSLEWRNGRRTGLKNPLLAISGRHASSLATPIKPLILLTFYHFYAASLFRSGGGCR
jgi:hypothetical protein